MKFFKTISAFMMMAGLAAVSLAGCSNATTSSTAATVTNIIDQVSSVTKTTCAFIPTATTIANILAKGDSNVSTASQIATAICGSVATAKKTKLGAGENAGPELGFAAPPVAGVPVEGVLLR